MSTSESGVDRFAAPTSQPEHGAQPDQRKRWEENHVYLLDKEQQTIRATQDREDPRRVPVGKRLRMSIKRNGWFSGSGFGDIKGAATTAQAAPTALAQAAVGSGTSVSGTPATPQAALVVQPTVVAAVAPLARAQSTTVVAVVALVFWTQLHKMAGPSVSDTAAPRTSPWPREPTLVHHRPDLLLSRAAPERRGH